MLNVPGRDQRGSGPRRAILGAVGHVKAPAPVRDPLAVIGVAYEDDLTPYSLISLGAHFSDEDSASSGAKTGMRL